MVKNPPAKASRHNIQVRSLGREHPLEEETATHSSLLAWRIPMDRRAWRAQEDLEEEMATCSRILAWKIPRTEEPGRLRSTGSQTRLKRLSTHACLHSFPSTPVLLGTRLHERDLGPVSPPRGFHQSPHAAQPGWKPLLILPQPRAGQGEAACPSPPRDLWGL